MTFDEMLAKVLEIFPHAEVSEAVDGEIVIHTKMQEAVTGGDSEEPKPVLVDMEQESMDESSAIDDLIQHSKSIRHGKEFDKGNNDLHVIIDGPPSHESGRFIEVEDSKGASVDAGDWRDRGDGTWELIIPSS